jgi:acyl carrier protein
MEREKVLGIIRVHLAEELGVDPDQINEATSFRDDLEADSLDLYTLLQELEDTFSLKLSDEEAAAIETVSQAIDAVIQKGGNNGGQES